MSHYDVLGVPKDADEKTIRKAYRKKAAKAHPDREGGNESEMSALNRAYEILCNPQKRLIYDATGKDAPKPPLDLEARNALMEIFMSLLTGEMAEHINFVKQAEKIVQGKEIEIGQVLTNTVHKIQRFKKLRSRVKKRHGTDNVFHMLVDQQVRDLEIKREQTKHIREVAKRVREMLTEYEGEDLQQTMFMQIGTGTSSATW